MSQKAPSKDDALEALDFIINVLREHEKDLDRLVNELNKITERLGELGETSERMGGGKHLNILSGKIDDIEKRLTNLQGEISNLLGCISSVGETRTDLFQVQKGTAGEMRGPTLILHCKKWEDFQTQAKHAQTISFAFKEAENTFQIDAFKNGQIITYTGEAPKTPALFKAWLSKRLDVPEESILEGTITVH
ncbi:MAG: hypothetical protein QW056_05710 [Candidatus Bathyarchaeia archaeon]